MPYGAIPPQQRRLSIIVAAVCIVVMIGGAVLLNLLAGAPIDWFWLISGTVLVSVLLGLFLWVRLSE